MVALGGRSVEKGVLGWECWEGNMVMGAWGKESGNESMWMGERERSVGMAFCIR